LYISSFKSEFKTSQVQPEPKFQIQLAVNFSLKVSKLQKSRIIISHISPFATPHAFGDKQFQ